MKSGPIITGKQILPPHPGLNVAFNDSRAIRRLSGLKERARVTINLKQSWHDIRIVIAN